MSPVSKECWESNRRLYGALMKNDRQTSTQTAPASHSGGPKPDGVPKQSLSREPMITMASPGQCLSPPPPAVFPSAIASQPAHDFVDLTAPEEQLSYSVRSPAAARSKTLQRPCPDYLSTGCLPLTRPKDPDRRRQILSLARPELFVVEYGCGCRNRGTCIHYQICFDRSKLPDGLICETCKESPETEKPIRARRDCPQHQDDCGMGKNHVRSRPEDFLATDEQAERYVELMERSMAEKWDGVPQALEGRIWTKPVSRKRAPAVTRKSVVEQPALTAVDHRPRPAVPSTLIHPDTSSEISRMSEPVRATTILGTEPAVLAPADPFQDQGSLHSLAKEQGTGLDSPFPLPSNTEFDDSWMQNSGVKVGDGDLGSEQREANGQEVGREMVGGGHTADAPGDVLFADLRTIESGISYQFDLDEFVQGSGMLG